MASRSQELGRCLRRHGVGNLRDLKARRLPAPKHSGFRAYEPGLYPPSTGEVSAEDGPMKSSGARYLFVAIDRNTLVFIRSTTAKTAANARSLPPETLARLPYAHLSPIPYRPFGTLPGNTLFGQWITERV